MASACPADIERPASFGTAPVPAVRVAICAAGEIWGGVERFIVTMAAGLRDAGINPLVVLFHDGLLADTLRRDGIDVATLARFSKYDPRLIAQLRRLLRERSINILHLHGYKASIVGSLASAMLGIKTVKTEHGCLEPLPGWTALPTHSRMAANIAIDRAVSRCFVDGVVFVSRDIQQRLGRRSHSPRQHVIYNGIPPIAPSAAAERRQPERRATFDVGIVGRIDKVKGHDVLFRALVHLKHLDRLRVHVFGTGPLEDECRAMCQTLQLGDTVRFHGFEPAIHDRMASLDLVVIPSRHEGLPYALLEAMYLKVPVIASDVGGLPEVLERQRCGVLVAPDEPARLAAAIERLYHDAPLRACLAQRAFSVVRRHFLVDDMVRQYHDVYRQLLVR
jgi:glycosyltransferase involved in cell wall biosynthesis